MAIDTIFYFANNQAEYDELKANVHSRTISFVPKDYLRGNIYKNGIRYGGVDSELDFETIKDMIKNMNATSSDDPINPADEPLVFNDYEKWLKIQIDLIKNTFLEEKTRVEEYINDKDLDIRDLVDHMFEDYKSIIQQYLSTGNPNTQQFTFGTDASEWISQLGFVTDNNDGTYNVNWSTFLQTISQIKAEVDQIKATAGTGGETNYEALSAGLYSYIESDIATSGLNSNWVRLFGGGWDSEDRTILEWMAADVKTWANNQQAFADVMAAAREYDSEGKELLQEAAAGIHALVEKQPDNTYKATATLSALVDDAYAGVVTEALKDEAMAQFGASMEASIGDKVDEVFSGIRSDVERILNELGGYDYVTSNTFTSAVSDINASLSTKVNYNDLQQAAETAVTASIGDVVAGMDVLVKQSNGHIDSNVSIYGDQIDLTGGHSINLNADNININSFTSNENFINALNSNLTVKRLSAGSNGTIVSANEDGITVSSGDVVAADFNADGSGSVANGAISWTSNGTIEFNEVFINKLAANLALIDILRVSSSAMVGEYSSDSSGIICNISLVSVGGNQTVGIIRIKDVNTTYASISASNNGGIITLNNQNSTSTYTADTFSLNNKVVARGYTANGELDLYSDAGSNVYLSSDPANTGILITNNSEDRSAALQILSISGPSLIISDGSSTSTFNANGTSGTSDVRLKNIKNEKVLTASLIANAPSFVYSPIDKNDQNFVGTSAQYWQGVLPETVSTINNYLALDYNRVATISVINLAREVVALQQEKTALIERVEALEARLQIIESKLNS